VVYFRDYWKLGLPVIEVLVQWFTCTRALFVGREYAYPRTRVLVTIVWVLISEA